MHLVVAAQIYPHPQHSSRAANVVLFEMLRCLSELPGIDVSFLPVLPKEAAKPTALEADGLAALASRGLRAQEALHYPTRPAPPLGGIGSSLWDDRTVRFYPAIQARKEAERRMSELKPDVVLTVWSEQATALLSEVDALRFAYYGDPDMKAGRARMRFNRRHGGSLKDYLVGMRSMKLLERAHLREMRKWHLHGNVAANHAVYYESKGHPNSFYIQNIWLDREGPPTPEVEPIRDRPAKIIANVGRLSSTANTYGIEYLATKLLPELRRQHSRNRFELHLLGAAEPVPCLAPLLDEPEIVVRGFVEDIDQELKSADVFLCVNNATEYNVGHTRYLHAWSLGCCVIASTDVQDAMPELVDRHNALLGQDASGLAAAIVEAIKEPDLRRQMMLNGYETFSTQFVASVVAPKVVEHIETWSKS